MLVESPKSGDSGWQDEQHQWSKYSMEDCLSSSTEGSYASPESVLFTGTQFSNLYTSVDTPARVPSSSLVQSWLAGPRDVHHVRVRM